MDTPAHGGPRDRSQEDGPGEGTRTLAPQIAEFCAELRREGMKIGTSELLDAFTALSAISWNKQSEFREALSATLAKSPEDRELFDPVFDRFFFRATEWAALQEKAAGAAAPENAAGVREGDRPGEVDTDQLRQAIIEAMQSDSDSALRDLARLAVSALGAQGEGSGVIGVDVQRIRRTLGLRSEDFQRGGDFESKTFPHDQLRRFERHLRRELEAGLIEQTETLPPTRPLSELNRGLATHRPQDLASVHRAVSQLRRAMATQGHELRGRSRSPVVDVRSTMRSSLETGGVPIRLKYRPRRPRKPELFVLCDVSTSVSSASVFFLSILHALHDSFKRLRSFVFIERVAEVTEVFASERDFAGVSEKISTTAGVADVSGYTDYGRVWKDFLIEVGPDLDARSTVIVMGDARTNGRDAEAALFGKVAERAGRMFWLNPEPQLYWNYGDSVISVYEPFCDGLFECWTTKQLEDFVRALTTTRATR